MTDTRHAGRFDSRKKADNFKRALVDIGLIVEVREVMVFDVNITGRVRE